MLVLTLGTENTVQIGDDIFVSVLKVHQNGRVKLGVVAPKDLRVSRPDMKGYVK